MDTALDCFDYCSTRSAAILKVLLYLATLKFSGFDWLQAVGQRSACQSYFLRSIKDYFVYVALTYNRIGKIYREKIDLLSVFGDMLHCFLSPSSRWNVCINTPCCFQAKGSNMRLIMALGSSGIKL